MSAGEWFGVIAGFAVLGVLVAALVAMPWWLAVLAVVWLASR